MPQINLVEEEKEKDKHIKAFLRSTLMLSSVRIYYSSFIEKTSSVYLTHRMLARTYVLTQDTNLHF